MGRVARSQSGMAVILAAVTCFIIAFMFATLARSSSNLRHITSGVLEESQARVFAGAAAEIFWSFFEECLRQRSGCPKLFPVAGCDTPLNPFSGITLEGFTLTMDDFDDHEGLEESFGNLAGECAANTPAVQKFEVEVAWHPNRNFSPVDGLKTRLDGTLEAIIRVVFQTSRETTTWQFGKKDVHVFSFSREFKLYQLLPAPNSRFTLFVKNCQQEQFNIQDKKFQEDDGKQQLLVLHNSPQSFSSNDLEAWKKSGWVFLGGDRVVLNIDGSHPCRTQSEYFFFYPSVAYQPDSVQLFSCVSLFADSPLRFGWVMLGCNEEWVTSVPMRWLIDFPFNLRVAGAMPKLVEHVSVLRLFGDKRHITPTRVLGKVHFRGVFYGALMYDANEDGLADELVPDASGTSGGPRPATIGAFPLVRVPSAENYPPNARYPSLLNLDLYELFDLGNYGVPKIPESLGNLLPNFEGQTLCYRNLMSMVSYEDFFPENSAANAMYDGIYAGAGTGIDPVTKTRLKNFGPTDYPDNGRDFALKANWNSDLELSKGDLATIDVSAPFRNRSFFATTFANQKEFLSEGPLTTDSSQTRLAKASVIKVTGDLQLPDNFLVTAPCLIVADGNITAGRIDSGKPGSSPHGNLILCSLAGNIDLAGGDIGKAILLAPNGTVTWKTRLTMKGSVSVDHLLPESIAGCGGRIDYEAECNIAEARGFVKGLTVILGPALPGFQDRQRN